MDSRLVTHQPRQPPGHGKAEGKGEQHPGQSHPKGHLPLTPYSGKIDLHAGDQQKKDDGQGRQGIEGDGATTRTGKKKQVRGGGEDAEDGRPPQNAGEDLAEDGRQIEAAGRLPQQAGGGQQQPQGEEQGRYFMVAENFHGSSSGKGRLRSDFTTSKHSSVVANETSIYPQKWLLGKQKARGHPCRLRAMTKVAWKPAGIDTGRGLEETEQQTGAHNHQE